MAAPNFLDKFKLDIDKSLLSAAKMKPGDLANKNNGQKLFAEPKSFTFEKVRHQAIKKANPLPVDIAPSLPLQINHAPVQEIEFKEVKAEYKNEEAPVSLINSIVLPPTDPQNLNFHEITSFDGAEFSSIGSEPKIEHKDFIIEEEVPQIIKGFEGPNIVEHREEIVELSHFEPSIIEEEKFVQEESLPPESEFSIDTAMEEMVELKKQLISLDPNLKTPSWPPVQELANPNQKKLNSIIIKGQKVLIFKMMCYSIANKLSLDIEALEKDNYPYHTKKEVKKKVLITAAHLKKIGIDLNERDGWDMDEDEEGDLDMEDIARLNARNFEYGVTNSDFSFINPIGNKINQQRMEQEARDREKKMSKYRKTLDIYSDDEASVYQKAIAQFLSENQEILDNIIEDDHPAKPKRSIDSNTKPSITHDDDDDYLDDIDD